MLAVYRLDRRADVPAHRSLLGVRRWLAQTTLLPFSPQRHMSLISPRVIRVSGHAERAWESLTIRRLAGLARLEPGWDGPQSEAISDMSLIAAQWFLRASMRDTTVPPNVVPTRTGGVQFEWHARGLDVEVEISRDAAVNVYIADLDSGTEYEGSGFAGFWQLAGALGRLS